MKKYVIIVLFLVAAYYVYSRFVAPRIGGAN